MTSVSFDKDPTKLIVSELRKSSNLLPSHQKNYFQVDYSKKQIVKLNPQDANLYQKSFQEQNIRQYFEQSSRDEHRYLKFKYQIKSKYFKIPSTKPKTFEDRQITKQPLEMIKSYSQNPPFLYKDRSSFSIQQCPLSHSQILNRKKVASKSRYSDLFQVLLQNSQRLTKKPSRYKLKNGTILQRQKIAGKIMNEQKSQILNIVKDKNYNYDRPESIQKIPNKDKYSLDFIDYIHLKTKINLQRQLFQKKIRKPSSRLQHFQQFIIDEGKFKGKAKQRLQDYYIKIRDEIRKSAKSNLHHPKQT